MSRGRRLCGLDSETRRITTRNERNPCQWTSFAFPIFIVPALNSRRASCFPSVARERQGRDCSIYLELRNSSYHLVVFFPLFLLLFYPGVSHGFALFNRVSLGYLPFPPPLLLLLLFKEKKEDQESQGKTSQERILISLINLHTREFPLSFVSNHGMEWQRGIYFFISFCKTVFFSFPFFPHVDPVPRVSQSASFVLFSRNFYSSITIERFFPPFSSSSFFFFRPKIHEFPTNQRIVKRWGAVCCLKDSAEFVRKRVRVSNSAWSEHGGRSICAHIIIQIPV